MSEYQYYEFQAIDRPLSKDDMRWLRGLSTRAQITATSFVNVYHWGDFRGDPIKLMERCFDVFLYVTNWGYRRFMVRLPRASFDAARAKQYCHRDGVSLRKKKDCVLLEFDRDDEPGEWEDWDDGSGWMASLTAICFTIFQTLVKSGIDPKKWFLAYFEACAQSGGRVPENLDEFMPWNLSQQQKDAWRCPEPFT